jgi:pimeloyl-ACP methyl ester carboxylesterase
MKKSFLIMALMTAGLSSHAQNFDGSWTGKLKAGAQEFTIEAKVNQAQQSVSASIANMGSAAVPLTVSFLSGDSISVAYSPLDIAYQGKREGDVVKGVFVQHGIRLPMELKRGEVTYNRPQNPAQPYPYQTEDVTFDNKTAGVTLAGTLTYPVGYKAGSKVPVVLMVTGSGPENRDEELFHHKPFLVIADYLARHGIASLRYDDRGTAKSSGNYATATTTDFAADAEAGLNCLRLMKKFSKVGLLGHSEGGLIGYMLGSKGKTDFIVSLAGPACKIDTMLMVQLNSLARVQGYNGQLVKDVATARQYMTINDKSAWMKTFIDMDATPYVKATTCPVLALAGDKDLNVPVSINNPSLEANLKKQPKTKIKVYPGLSHLFQHSATGNPMDAAKIDETIAPEVLTDIAEWISSVAK